MRTLIFATGNESKAKRFSKGLKDYGIEVKSLKDLNITLDVLEDGETAIQNALKKARACYEKTHMTSIGMDDTLYLENVPDSRQPGLYVRRVNGKNLTDEEMIEHYTSLVKQYGEKGRLNSKWVYGLALIDAFGKEYTYTWSKDNFYMVDVPSEERNVGYPLNSISKYKINHKYFTEVSEKEKALLQEREDDVIRFIVEHFGKEKIKIKN